VYQKIHIAFVENQNSDGSINIGAAFPGYTSTSLGNILRLIAIDGNELNKLNIGKYLRSFSDYIKIDGIKDIPKDIQGYMIFNRIQPESSKDRIARRKAKRENISFEDAMKKIGDKTSEFCSAPYIQMKSYSSDKRYKLFIGSSIANQASEHWEFSTYGLSSITAVPMF
jgi:CRISPR-associated endonuclease Csy4